MPQNNAAPNPPQQGFDLGQVTSDPDFMALGFEDKRSALTAMDPDFARLSPLDQTGVLQSLRPTRQVPNANAIIGQGKNQVAATIDRRTAPFAVLANPVAAALTDKPESVTDQRSAMTRLAQNPAQAAKVLAPAAGIGASLFTGGMGPLAAALYMTLAGAGGESANQLIQTAAGTKDAPTTSGDALSNIAGSGIGQGLAEVGGRAMMWPLKKLLTGLLAPAASDKLAPALLDLNDKYKLGMNAADLSNTPMASSMYKVGASGLFGNPLATAGYEKTNDAMVKMLLDKADAISTPATREQLGSTLAKQFDLSNQVLKEQFGPAVQNAILNAQKQGATINLTPVKQEMIQELRQRTMSTVAGNKGTQIPKDMVDIFRLVLQSPDQVTPTQASNILTRISDSRPKEGNLMSGEAEGAAKHYGQRMYDTIGTSLSDFDKANGTQLASDYTTARAQYRTQVADLFAKDRSTLQTLRDTAMREPEKVIQQIQPGDVSKVKDVYDALHRFQPYAAPQDKLAAQQAWSSFQREFAVRRLMSNDSGVMDLAGLGDRLNRAGDQQLQQVFNTPESRTLLTNMRYVSQALDRMAKPGSMQSIGVSMLIHGIAGAATWGGGHAGFGPLESLGTAATVESVPYATMRVLQNPTATRFLVRGISGMAEHNQIANPYISNAVSLMGRATGRPAPFLGPAAADIFRAFQIANGGVGQGEPYSTTPPAQKVPAPAAR